MNEFEKQLEQELIEQGASVEEIGDLIGLKNKITKLSDIRRSDTFKKSFLRRLEEGENHGKFYPERRFLTPVLFLSLLVFILVAGVVSAQNSLPGQPLYPVKILSENIIKTVRPSFRDEILKRRTEEIKALAKEKKSSEQVKKTIDKYEKDLEENKNIDTNKMKESRENLEDAKDNSEGEDKKEIEDVIKKTEDKIKKSHKDENENRSEEVKGAKSSRGSDHGEEAKNKNKSHEDEDHED